MTIFKRGFLLFSMLLLAACSPAAAQGKVEALFINVGKADAALFFLGDQRYLVDVGTKDAHEQLMRTLEAYGIDHLDGIFITHTDKDHAGGLKKLLKTGIGVDVIYASALHSETDLDDHRAYEAAQQYEKKLIWLRAGEEIQAADGSVFRVLGPLTKDPDKENNNSLVLHLVTAEGDMLLTGDMEYPEEQELMAQGLIPQADVLKVPNHGEDDATGRDFALAVKAQWAIISTDSVEEPDTPSEKVLQFLHAADTSVAFTEDASVGILICLQGAQVTVQQLDWQ